LLSTHKVHIKNNYEGVEPTESPSDVPENRDNRNFPMSKRGRKNTDTNPNKKAKKAGSKKKWGKITAKSDGPKRR